MVVIAPISAGQGLDVGSAPSTARDDSIGRGLRNLGSAVSQAGEAMGQLQLRAIQQRQKVEEFEFEQRWQRTQLGLAAEYDQAKVNIEPSGLGFTEKVNASFMSQYDEFLKTVPDHLKPRFAELVETDQQGRLAQAAADEVTQRSAWYEVSIGETVNRSQSEVAASPDMYDQKLGDVFRTIEASGLPPAKQADLKRNAEQMLGRAWLERVMRDDPAMAKTQLGVGDTSSRDDYYAAIRAAESGGDPNARNPRSSASGLYQFTNSTWNRLVEAYPSAGLTADGRSNPGQQERAVRLLTAENERTLGKAGFEASNANLYAAHFLGAGAAVKVLGAPDGAAIAGLLPTEYITANPFLRDMTVAEFKSWAAGKAGGSAAPSAQPAPQVAALPFAERVTLYDQAVAAENAQITAQKAAATAAYNSEKGRLELAIENGEVASKETILSSVLSDSDKATLLGKLSSQQGRNAAAQTVVDAFTFGNLGKVNPYDADQRKVVGDAYDLLMKATPEDQRQAAAVAFVEQTGVVPDPVVAVVRQGLNASDVALVGAALQQAAALFDAAPDGLNTVEHGRDIQDAAATYREMVTGRGLSVEQAAAEVIRLRDPAQRLKAEQLDPLWDQAVKNTAFKVEDVLSAFDAGMFGGGYPASGLTPQQSAAVMADYLSAAERHFKGAANGDPQLAKALAVEEMKRTYGVSATGGQRALMKYPPELFYPPRAGGHDYIRDLALADARTIDPNVANVMLVSTPGETTSDVRNGRPPRYNLYYQRPDGVWDMVPDMFTVDPASDAELARLDSEETRLRFEAARELKRRQAAMPLYGSGGKIIPIYGGGNGVTPPADAAIANPPDLDEITTQLRALEDSRKTLLGQPVVQPNGPEMATSDPLEEERKWLELNAATFGTMGGSPR